MLVLASGWSAGEGRELENVPDAWYVPIIKLQFTGASCQQTTCLSLGQ